MQETLHDHNTSTFIDGKPIHNLRFANNIDVVGGSNGELQDFTNRLIDIATTYRSQHGKEQDCDQQHEQHQRRCYHELPAEVLEEVTSFKYLLATL